MYPIPIMLEVHTIQRIFILSVPYKPCPGFTTTTTAYEEDSNRIIIRLQHKRSISSCPIVEERSNSLGNGHVVDGGEEKTESRLQWLTKGDTRLVSAWLNGSNDPIDGNNKKIEQYWKEVAVAYNSTTPKDRKREPRQLKQHFHRLKAKISNFNGSWNSMNSVYQSGMSDDQRTDLALKKYREDYKEHFKYGHLWKILRNEPKWCAYVQRMDNISSSSG